MDLLFSFTLTIIIYNIIKFILFKKLSPIIISIDGNIGSGKSTLIDKLKEKNTLNTTKNITFVDEPVKDWLATTDNNGENILDKFYKDKKAWSYIFQNFAFITRAKILLDEIQKESSFFCYKRKIIITERSVETDKYVFAKMLYDENDITELQYKIYNTWYSTIFPNIKVNNIIYLRTSPNTAFTRMLERNRKAEENVHKSYIQKLHEYHDDWLTNHHNCYNICYLDGDNDYDNNDIIFNEHLIKITNFIKSLS